MSKARQHTRCMKAAVCVALATVFVLGLLAWAPGRAFAEAPTIQGIKQDQTNVPVNLGEIEIYFGHNVAAGAVFDDNAAHVSLCSESGAPVAITVYRKYFGYGSPDAENRDDQGFRRALYVSIPTLEAQTTYTLSVSAGVRALGSISYDAASVTFTTEAASTPDEGDQGGGGSGSGGGAGASSGSDSGSGTGSGAGSGSETDQPSKPGSSESGSSGEGPSANPGQSPTDNPAKSPDEATGTASGSNTDAPNASNANAQALLARTQDAQSELVVDAASTESASSAATAARLVKLAQAGGSASGGSGGGNEVAENAAGTHVWFALLCLAALLAGALRQKAKRNFAKDSTKKCAEKSSARSDARKRCNRRF